MSCIFFPVVLAPRQRSRHRCSCFTVHSSGIFRGKIAPGTSSSLRFMLSDLLLSITSTLLLSSSVKTLLSPLQSALTSAMFVLTRVPPNNPISACGTTSPPLRIPIPYANTFSCILIVDRFTNERHSYTKETIHLPRLVRSIPTLIGSCIIYYVLKIKAGRFRKRYLSCNHILSISLVNFLQDGSKHSSRIQPYTSVDR